MERKNSSWKKVAFIILGSVFASSILTSVASSMDQSQEYVSQLERENQLLKTENSQLKTENSQLNTENSQLNTENSQLNTENSQLNTTNDQLNTTNDQLKTENSWLRKVGTMSYVIVAAAILITAFAVAGAMSKDSSTPSTDDVKIIEDYIMHPAMRDWSNTSLTIQK